MRANSRVSRSCDARARVCVCVCVCVYIHIYIYVRALYSICNTCKYENHASTSMRGYVCIVTLVWRFTRRKLKTELRASAKDDSAIYSWRWNNESGRERHTHMYVHRASPMRRGMRVICRTGKPPWIDRFIFQHSSTCREISVADTTGRTNF